MSQKRTIYLKDYQPPDFLIDAIDLEFDLGELETRVQCRLDVRRNGDHSRPLILDGENLKLNRVQLNGETLKPDGFKLSNETLTITTSLAQFQLATEVTIQPQKNTALSGLYRSSGNFCTQCEAEGFRRITYSLDRPDVLSRYKTAITAKKDQYPVLLSNGNLVESTALSDGRHRAVWEDPFPKPSYLFALVAGDLAHVRDSFETRSSRVVDLYIYTQHHNIDKCAHAMDSLRQAMAWDEKVYGREYDLDLYMIVAVDDFNMGAMENKGLNIFNSKYVLASPETATDTDYESILGVIAHEYFHNWSGNRVTCRDWFQLSLKEGFTVFRDQEFSADKGSRGVQRIKDVNVMRAHQFVEDAGPMAHPVRPQSYQEINNFYTTTVYNKGAEVVRMLHTLVGEKGFRKGTDYYFEKFDGQAVTTDDFVRSMERENGLDLDQFKNWYDQAGTPVLALTTIYDEAKQTYSLGVAQSCPATPGQKTKKPFQIPLTIALFDSSGTPMEITPNGTQTVLQVTQKREKFIFENIPERPVLSALRGFSAPVKINIDYTDDELYFLMVHDDDPFARWEATQRLSTKIILSLVKAVQKQQDLVVDNRYLTAVGEMLGSTETDGALMAQLLKLPVETYISEFLEVIDPDAVQRARNHLKISIGMALWDGLLDTYRRYASKPYEINAHSIGGRSLKNTCLDYLVSTDKDEAISLAMQQFNTTSNMTDTMSAMSALNNSSGSERKEVLSGFYKKWHQDALAVDKWLQLQAVSALPNTLGHVKDLTRHESFNLNNPNKTRALIGSFAHGNSVHFHQLSGAGYEFVANYVIKLDPVNPQVAARLVTAFQTWRRYSEPRQDMIKTRLREILNQPGLSSDVGEIVSKALA